MCVGRLMVWIWLGRPCVWGERWIRRGVSRCHMGLDPGWSPGVRRWLLSVFFFHFIHSISFLFIVYFIYSCAQMAQYSSDAGGIANPMFILFYLFKEKEKIGQSSFVNP